ncbi:MAG TPA: tRNA epoxyqueuosine(34) reductase QueG [Candidatus Polarisedimenticolia bacterium]|nr:tRNA epoxyqueuosine(34) reductase QueG [Candidatus Polarisedimenticolia bacterium]
MIPSQANASTKQRIAEAARALGFGAVGFASASVAPHAERLHAWLAEGRHGTMRWMARDPERRVDPRVTLRGARTVISVSIPYYRGDWPEAADDAPRGRIARYAWGRDYHKRIRRRLRNLARAVQEASPEARWVAYVDTGPMLDRAWAERAGIGWIGKNTNVILQGHGSYSFLGEILTDLTIDPDPPARDHCGTCARCITACPTGAILGPYQLDARRCISYLTIEHRGSIPLELRPAIGTRIFGCDDCQEVCPWNRFAVPTQDPDFADRPGQATPELIPLLGLDEEGFRARYQGTAILRAKRAGFARNVAVALGNTGDSRAVPALARALEHDSDPMVRGHAAWALGRIGSPSARAALQDAASRETSAEAIHEIHAALGITPAATVLHPMEGASPP